ncbi:MAG: hypothetical protein OEU87_04615, partial [Nitrospira sp.]|nr:hypothetical protein [Nitrospira sp.]
MKRARIPTAIVLGSLMSMCLWPGFGCAEGPALVLEDFKAKEADGFPSAWEHENQRSQSKGREAY